MQITVISYLGVFAIVVLVAFFLGMFSFVDRRILSRVVRVFVYFAFSLALVGCYAWGLLKLNQWWVALLGALTISVVTSYFSVLKGKIPLGRFLLPIALSQMIGMIIGIGCSLLLIKSSPVITITAVAGMMSSLFILSTGSAIKVYVNSLKHTNEHYIYLLSNGATHFEAIQPSVRRCLRASVMPLLHPLTSPIVVAPPVFYCALLLSGMSPLLAVTVVVLLSFLGVAICFFVAVIAMLFSDRFIFDRSGRLLI